MWELFAVVVEVVLICGKTVISADVFSVVTVVQISTTHLCVLISSCHVLTVIRWVTMLADLQSAHSGVIVDLCVHQMKRWKQRHNS